MIASDSTNHKTRHVGSFHEPDRPYNTWVKTGDGRQGEVKEKVVVSINTLLGTKLITDELYAPE